jgi:hypothetical protein
VFVQTGAVGDICKEDSEIAGRHDGFNPAVVPEMPMRMTAWASVASKVLLLADRVFFALQHALVLRTISMRDDCLI